MRGIYNLGRRLLSILDENCEDFPEIEELSSLYLDEIVLIAGLEIENAKLRNRI